MKNISSIKQKGYFLASFLVQKDGHIEESYFKDARIEERFHEQGEDLKNFFDIMGKSFNSQLKERLQKTILNKEFSTFHQFFDFNGSNLNYNFIVNPINEDKSIIIIQTLEIEDASDIKKNILSSSLNDFIDKHPYPLSIYDKEGHYIKGNKKYLELFGSTPANEYSILNDTITKNEPWWEEVIIKIKRGETVHIPQMWYDAHEIEKNAASKRICIETDVVPIKGPRGEVQNYILIYEDVTEKVRIKTELEEERFILNEIIELNPYAIEFKDPQGHHIKANKAFMELWKSAPPKEFSIFDLPTFNETGVSDKIRQASEGEVIEIPEVWLNPHTHAVGTGYDQDNFEDHLRCVNSVVFPVFNEQKQVKYLIFMFEDITERKLALQKLEKLKDELEKRIGERTRILEQSQESYKKAYNRATCFKGLFTHDINNIIHSIGNAIEYCRKKINKDQELEEFFDLIEKQIEKGNLMVRNIQNLSDIEKSEMIAKPVSLKKTLISAIDFVKNSYRKKNINIQYQGVDDAQYVSANVLLGDAFENILKNAIEYNKNEKITIDVFISEVVEDDIEYLTIAFQDNGIGIPSHEKRRIFQPDAIKKHSKGMGLGLSHISRLLALWNGEIWVEDNVPGDFSKGSNFIIRLEKVNL